MATTENPYESGVGGKFRKKSFRRQTTPYDRPNNSSKVGWLKNLVVDQASKLLAFGTNRFFGSVVQKQILPAQDVNHDDGEVIPESAPNEELMVSNSSQPINSSNGNWISELEMLLKRNTFTRPEALHLIELLHSRAVKVVTPADESKRTETPSVFGRYDETRSEGEGVRSHGTTTSTPVFNARVHDEDIGSPAELAKAYMGSRSSKVSPSMLGANRQVGREDTRLLNNIPFITNSPILPLTRKNSSVGAVENCFVTPRSRGRSALFNMARTPYSRVHPASSLKGGGNNNNDFGSSTPIAITEHGEKREFKSTNLKRRSSYLDDDVGFGPVGSIRSIRQKQNLLVPRMPQSAHGVGIGSAKQKLPLVEANHDRNENGSVASTSHAVPTRARQVASKILQHLDKMSPEEKSPGSRIAAVMDKSPFKSTPGVLHEQACRSMEDVGTSEFILNGNDYDNMEDKSNTNIPNSRESTQNQENVGETGGKESVAPLNLRSPAKKNDEFVMPLKIGTSDFLARDNASLHPQKKRAFRMNGQESGDGQYNGIAPVSLSKEKGPIEENSLSTAEDSKSSKTNIQAEVKLTSGFVFSKTSEFSAPGSEKAGEISNGIALRASEETSKASQSAVVPSPATVFDEPKDNLPSLFASSSNAGDKFPPLTSESSSINPELKLDEASKFSNISAPNGFRSKSLEFEKADHLKAADKIGESDIAPPALNGLFGTGNSTTSFGITSKSAFAPATTQPLASAPSATEISQVTDSIGGSNPIVSSFSSSNSGNDKFGLASSTPNNSQGSVLSTNSGNAFSSVFSSLPPFNTNYVTPVSEFTSTLTKLGSSFTASDNNAISSAPTIPFTSSSSVPSNEIGSVFGSTFNFSNPSTGFVFNSSCTPTAPTNTSQPVFSSPSRSPIFQFGAASAPAISTPPIFSNTNSIFEMSPGKNNDQMYPEVSMADDPVQSTPRFGQPEVSHSPPGFMFGQEPPFQANPFQFGGQMSQAPPNPYKASSSLEFSAGGSGFSLGSGGDKSTRRIVKVNRNKLKKK